jgi:hypothetical protein
LLKACFRDIKSDAGSYNSIIYPSIVAEVDYQVFWTPEPQLKMSNLGFNKNSNVTVQRLEFGDWTESQFNLSDRGAYFPLAVSGIAIYEDMGRMSELLQRSDLSNLTSQQCLDAYSRPYISQRRNLIVVTTNITAEPLVSFGRLALPITNESQYQWICKSTFEVARHPTYTAADCTRDIASIDGRDWQVERYDQGQVLYCLSEDVEERCRLRWSFLLTIAVIACNFVKICVLTYTWYTISEDPILTMGDAVASFLETPDETTQGYCLMGWKDVHWWKPVKGALTDGVCEPRHYNSKPGRWRSSVKTDRWLFCLFW